jgi:hypothetical protein
MGQRFGLSAERVMQILLDKGPEIPDFAEGDRPSPSGQDYDL